jgi:hypothetical protein
MARNQTSQSLAEQLSSDFDSDWSEAQDKYNNAIKAGYDPADAETQYLAPVRTKYQIISQTPSLLGNQRNLMSFTKEYDDETSEFQKRYNSFNRDGGAWAAQQTIKPLLDKWSIKASLPSGPSQQQQEQIAAYQEFAEGKPPSEILKEHPSLALDKSFDTLVARDLNRDNRPAPLSDVQKAQKSVLTSTLVSALNDNDPARIQAATASLDAFDKKYGGGGARAATSMVPSGNVPQGTMTPSLLRPSAPLGTSETSDIPDLTGNSQAIAALPYGAKYYDNGSLRQAFHATPLPSGSGVVIGSNRQGTASPVVQNAPAPPVAPAITSPATLTPSWNFKPPVAAGAPVQTPTNPVVVAPAAAQSAPIARTFKDKSGQKFVYTGTSADPSTDKNPANWSVAQ